MPLRSLRCLLAMFSAALMLWGGFMVFALTGDNYQRVMPVIEVTPDELDWQMLVGEGVVDETGFTVLGSIERTHGLLLAIHLPQTVNAERVDRIELHYQPGARYRQMNLGWGGQANFPRSRMAPIDMMDESLGLVETGWLPNWRGEIRFLAVEIVGGLSEPLVLQRIELIPARPDFVQLQRQILSEWLAFPPWTQRSAHHTRVSLQSEIMSPVVALAAWAGLSILLILAIPWVRAGASIPLLLTIPVACAWLLLDLRWQAELVAKAHEAMVSMGDKGYQEKRSAEFDGDLFSVIERIQEKVETTNPRVFALGYGEFWRLRTRYHAVPWSVRSTDRRLAHAWTRYLRQGDLLIVLDAPHVDRMELRKRGAPGVADLPVEYDLEKVAAGGARLIEVDGRSILSLKPGGARLLQARYPAPPTAGVQVARIRLASSSGVVEARAQVRRRDEEGEWVTSFDRSLSVSGPEFEDYRLVFAVDRGAVYEVRVIADRGDELSAERFVIESVGEPDLLYLRSGPEGPFLVVRPLLENPIATAYEVL